MIDDSFRQILDGLERSDEDAAQEVFCRFTERLLRLAHSRLSERFSQRVDAEDVLQSVFRTFFRRQKEGQFNLENWQSLWGLLVLVTLRKCGKQIDSLQAACRDVRRERDPHGPEDATGGQFEYAVREPSPAEVASLTETLERLTAGLPATDQEILSLRLEGHTLDEVGQRVNRTKRTVIRTMNRIRERLLLILDADDPD